MIKAQVGAMNNTLRLAKCGLGWGVVLLIANSAWLAPPEPKAAKLLLNITDTKGQPARQGHWPLTWEERL